MRSTILLVCSLTLACRPGNIKVDPVDENPNDSDLEQSTDSSTNDSTPETNTQTDDELRCCYGIEMIDYGGNGWQRGLLSVLTDGGVYANVFLPDGFDGFREVCLARGETVTFSWNEGLDNDEVGLGIFSFEGEDYYFGEAPESGVLKETTSTCSDEFAVNSSYQEYDSTDNSIDDVDPDEPDYGDPEAFAGQYIGIFEMFSHDTGEQLCLVDMVIDIDQNGTFAASEVCSFFGRNTYVSHTGNLLTEMFETDVNGNVFAFASVSGLVDITDDTGMITVQSEFYGECFLETNNPYINVYWDSMLYPLNGSPQTVFGQLYYPY